MRSSLLCTPVKIVDFTSAAVVLLVSYFEIIIMQIFFMFRDRVVMVDRLPIILGALASLHTYI